MDRLETAQLAYFVAVAEELHFGRAAEQLGISQPSLSRAVARLERLLGVRLLERTNRRVELTAPGEVFLREGRAALAAVDLAVLRTQRAARTGRLLIAVRPGVAGGLLPLILEGYSAQANPLPVDLVFTQDQVAAVRDGRADVALMCSTEVVAGLRVAKLMEEAPVALLPTSSRLSRKVAVTMAELLRLKTFSADCPELPLAEIIDRVALRQAVVIAGETVSDRLGRGVVAVPIADLPSQFLVLGWMESAQSPAIAPLVREARRVTALERRRLAAS